jgi:hypothetical protein
MIAAGQYDHVDQDISALTFSMSGSGGYQTRIEFFEFTNCARSTELISELRRAGYRPINIEELLALGETQPRLQLKFPIVALGSVSVHPYWGLQVCAALTSDVVDPSLHPAGRHLRLFCFDFPWHGNHRIGAVRI